MVDVLCVLWYLLGGREGLNLIFIYWVPETNSEGDPIGTGNLNTVVWKPLQYYNVEKETQI